MFDGQNLGDSDEVDDLGWKKEIPEQAFDMEEQLRRFWDRYPMDDRATKLLLLCPEHLQTKVIETFDPRNKDEVDYSRQVTGYIRSLQTEDASRKRVREEEDASAWKRARSETPSQAELNAFCERYPMDDRALEYLTSSSPAVQQKVLSEFRPRQENEADYSSLVTSLVKKMRMVVGASSPMGGLGLALGTPRGLTTRSAVTGPSLEQMREFKARFPMDERAWDFLLNAAGHTQEVVVNDFKPRRLGDADYSAPVTAFVRSITSRDRRSDAVSLVKLDLFREKWPVDERAFQYLCNAGPEMQREAMQNFMPKNLDETDFSRQLTAFLNRGQRGYAPEPQVTQEIRRRVDWRKVPDIREVERGGVRLYGRDVVERPRRDPPKGKGGGRLQAFRAKYPMDDRAFDYLMQADPNVQDMFLTEFQPKRRGMDDDYSASVTSFLKVVKAKVAEGHQATGKASDALLLEGFRRRYPMDDRAFEFLSNAAADLQRKVVESFRPRTEGEADYSGLITSFVKSLRR